MRVFHLSKPVLEELRAFFESQPEVIFAAIFGSLASRGDSSHDIDIAVKLACEDKYTCLARILDGASRLLGADLGSIDLVDMDRVDPVFKGRVLSQGLILVDRGYVNRAIKELSHILSEFDEYSSLSIREWLFSEDPASIDLEVVKRRVDFIKSEISFLQEYVLSKSRSEVNASPILRRLLERSYHLIVESFIDICRHIASAKGWTPSFTAMEFIEKCCEHEVINRDLAVRLLETLKLRNIIVHRYTDVDYDRLYTEAMDLVWMASEFERQLQGSLV